MKNILYGKRKRTRKTSFAFRLLADASPSHFFNSLTSQTNCSFSTLSPTNNSVNLSFDHCVAFFSFQCQLFGLVAIKKFFFCNYTKELEFCFSYHQDVLLQSNVDHLYPI